MFFHYVVILVTKTVTLTLCLNWLFIVSKENILWFYCNQSIALKNGRNPNVKYTLHGKRFCLNCKVECLKQTSTFDLHFESKYFVNSVADHWTKIVLWNDCWWNLENVHVIISSYNGLPHFEGKYFGMVCPTIYITYNKYCTTNIFVLTVWLEMFYLHSNYHMLKQKVFFIFWVGLETSSVY